MIAGCRGQMFREWVGAEEIVVAYFKFLVLRVGVTKK